MYFVRIFMRQSISIISDWKQQDFYTAALRQQLLYHLPDAGIDDVSHQVKAFDLMQAAFIMRSVWKYFPEKSIHLMCVRSEASTDHPHVLLQHKGHFFVGADHGYWPFICQETPEKAWLINDETHYSGNSFPELSVFVKVAVAIANNILPKEAGMPDYHPKQAAELQPVVEDSVIKASIIYFDSYGNAITNLKHSEFENVAKERKFRLFLMSEKNKISKISRSYGDVRQGSLCAVFNSQGLLEIAINEGNLKQLLNLQTGDALRIEFD